MILNGIWQQEKQWIVENDQTFKPLKEYITNFAKERNVAKS